jgi:GntR family transcriptional regulator
LTSSWHVYVDHVPAKPIDPYGRDHAYVQVANDVARRIETGEFTRKLPAERSLAEEYGCAYTTVRHAMDVLRERRLIVTVHGRGTFVAASLADDEGQPG